MQIPIYRSNECQMPNAKCQIKVCAKRTNGNHFRRKYHNSEFGIWNSEFERQRVKLEFDKERSALHGY